MKWSASSLRVADDLYGENQPLPTSQKGVFENITESSFHANQSLRADTGQLYDPLEFEFLEVVEGSFHEEDSLVRELLLNPLDETVQIGGGQTDYNIQLVKEKTRPMENMNAEAMLRCLENVLNSNEDVLFDSSCRIDLQGSFDPVSVTQSSRSDL